MSTEVLICKDCKHYVHTWCMKLQDEQPRCNYFLPNRPINIVTGEIRKITISDLETCAYLRDYDGHCGHSARWWTPKKDTAANLFKLLQRP